MSTTKPKTKKKSCKCKTCDCKQPVHSGTFTITFDHTVDSKGLSTVTMSQNGEPLLKSSCTVAEDVPLVCNHMLQAYTVTVAKRFKDRQPAGRILTEKDLPY